MSTTMADKTRNPAISSSVFRLRIACEECHTRKIRCCPSIHDSSGACEACRLNARKCLFSLKGKLGRPRKLTRTTSEIPDSLGGLVLETSQSKTAPVRTPTSRTYTSPSILEHLQERQDAQIAPAKSPNCDQDSNNNESTSSSLKSLNGTQLSLQEIQSQQVCFQEWEEDELRGQKRGVPDNGEMTEVRQMQTNMQLLESYDDPISAFANDFMDFSKDDFSQTPLSQVEMPPTMDDWSNLQSPTQQLSKKDIQTMEDGDLEIVQTYCEVRKQTALFSRQKRSLLADRDQDNLRQIMDTMQRLSREITSFSKNSSSIECRKSGQQSLAIVLFASVIQAVENVGQFKEFEDQSDGPGFGFQPQSQRRSQPSPPESIISMDDWGAVSGMRLELIMVVSRLDFFLMQFKAFISQFNSLVTIVSLFHPAHLIAKLQSLHHQIGIVLEKLRSEWA